LSCLFRYINKEEWCWRALRCLSRRCPYFYINWHPPGRSVKDYLKVILTEKLQIEDERRAARESGHSTSGSTRRDVSGNVTEPSPAKQPRLDSDTAVDGQPSTHSTRPKVVTTDGETGEKRGNVGRQESSQPSSNTHLQSNADDQDDSVLDEDDLSVKQDGDPDSGDRLVEGDSFSDVAS
uniref:Chromatin modification-related protein eaf-1-like n=1 Tax=Echinostoma caproni TaxID=27848 RepID=A0A183B3X9_9TREM